MTTPRTIAGLEIVGELGSGGMGVVWRARDPRLGRDVAVKGLPLEMLDDPARRRRLETEARAIASLNHPNVVTIHAIEEHEERPYLVMELVDGGTLREHIEPGGMAMARVLEWGIAIADALAAAHARGIVHRDLKPSNVMRTSEGTVKVLDFGLARMESVWSEATSEETPTRLLTREDSMPGTLLYMSPEQVGDGVADARSDLFALGVLLFEAATGRRPFEGSSLARAVAAILHQPAPRLRELRPDLPRELEVLIAECLEKDPERRPVSAVDVRDRLSAIRIALLSSGAGVPGPPAPRMPSWLAGFAGLAAVIVAGWWLGAGARGPAGDLDASPEIAGPSAGSASDGSTRSATGKPRIVVLPFENLGTPAESWFAEGMTEEITSRLTGLSRLEVVSRHSASSAAARGGSIREIGELLAADYALAGTIRWARSDGGAERVRITQQLVAADRDVQLWSETWDRELEDVFAIQSEIAREVAARLDLEVLDTEAGALVTAPTDDVEAYSAYLRGLDLGLTATFRERRRRDAEITRWLGRAVELDPGFGAAWAELVQHHAILVGFGFDDTVERRERLEHALERTTAVAPESPATTRALGFYHQVVTQRYDEAIGLYREALRSLPSDARIHRNLGSALRRQGHWEEAAEHYAAAQALDPRNGGAAHRLGDVDLHLRRYEAAARSFELATVLEPGDPSGWEGLVRTSWLATGEVEGAAEILDRAPGDLLEIRLLQEVLLRRWEDALRRLDGSHAEWVGRPVVHRPAELWRCWLLGRLGRDVEARAECELALQRIEAEMRDGGDEAKLSSARGICLALLGRAEDSVAAGERALELQPLERQPYFGLVHVEDMAWILAELGRPEEAVELLSQLVDRPAPLSRAFLRLDPRWDGLAKIETWKRMLEGGGISEP